MRFGDILKVCYWKTIIKAGFGGLLLFVSSVLQIIY